MTESAIGRDGVAVAEVMLLDVCRSGGRHRREEEEEKSNDASHDGHGDVHGREEKIIERAEKRIAAAGKAAAAATGR